MPISAWRCLTSVALLTTFMATVGCGQEPSLPKTVDLDLGGGVTMTLMLIPAGSFEMGSDKGDDDERPVHVVTITKPFYLGKYEVTQAQWQAVMGSNPSRFKHLSARPTGATETKRLTVSITGDKLPVDSVSWVDCQEFLKKLQTKAHLVVRGSPDPAPVPPALKFSLPTEAQWEYACRAGSKTECSFGDDTSRLDYYGWYSANSDNTTHDVGAKKPNAWGLYDMYGNVEEWCADWYAWRYPTGTQSDSSGPRRGEEVALLAVEVDQLRAGEGRVLRGGSWGCNNFSLRSARRLRDFPDVRVSDDGFRVAAAP
jgi:formylglycine-generating enzyme required for sulfatase activity